MSSNTVLRRVANRLFRVIGGNRTRNAFPKITTKSSDQHRPPAAGDGVVATRSVPDHAQLEPRAIVGAGRIFRAVRGMTASDGRPKPFLATLTRTVPPCHDLRQPAVDVDGPIGTVGGTRTRNAFPTVTVKSFDQHRLLAADDRSVATRPSFTDLARPEPRATQTDVGRVFRAVRETKAFDAGPKPSAFGRPKPSAAAPSKAFAARHVPPRLSVAINGFGRVGRCLLRLAFENNVNVVAINDPFVDLKSMERSFSENPDHGKFPGQVEIKEDNLCVNGKLIKVRHEENPEKIKWGAMHVDFVIDTSGKFTYMATALKHISPGGAKKVIIAAQSKDAPTFFKDVNYCDYKKTMSVVSTGSSTASCAVPLLHAMNEKFHMVSYMVSAPTTMPADRFFIGATNHTEPASGNVVGSAIPEMHNTSDGLCLLKFHMSLKTNANPNDIKCLVRKMATCSDDSAVSYCQDLDEFGVSAKHPISRHSAVVDFNHVHVDGKNVTVAAWYDNVTGRAARALDLVKHMTR